MVEKPRWTNQRRTPGGFRNCKPWFSGPGTIDFGDFAPESHHLVYGYPDTQKWVFWDSEVGQVNHRVFRNTLALIGALKYWNQAISGVVSCCAGCYYSQQSMSLIDWFQCEVWQYLWSQQEGCGWFRRQNGHFGSQLKWWVSRPRFFVLALVQLPNSITLMCWDSGRGRISMGHISGHLVGWGDIPKSRCDNQVIFRRSWNGIPKPNCSTVWIHLES